MIQKLRIGGLYKTARNIPLQAGYNPSIGSYIANGWWEHIRVEDTFLVLAYLGNRPETVENFLSPSCEQYTILINDKIGRIDIKYGESENWKECVE